MLSSPNEDYAKNLLALKDFIKKNLDAIKNQKRREPLDTEFLNVELLDTEFLNVELLDNDPKKLEDFHKFLEAAEALVEERSLEENDASVLEKIKIFFDESQGESQFNLLQKIIGNRVENPAVELLYFIQGMVFEIVPELESEENRDARLLEIAQSPRASRILSENMEDDDEKIQQRLNALRDPSFPVSLGNEMEQLDPQELKKLDEPFDNGDLYQNNRFVDVEVFPSFQSGFFSQERSGSGLQHSMLTSSPYSTPRSTMLEQEDTIEPFSGNPLRLSIVPTRSMPSLARSQREPIRLVLRRPRAPLTFMRDHSANINRLAKIEGKKGQALTAENVEEHVKKVLEKVDNMRALSSIKDDEAFLSALLKQKEKVSAKLEKWNARSPQAQAEHLADKKITAALHENLEAKAIRKTDSGPVVGFVMQRKNGEEIEKCIEEIFHKDIGLTTIDVFTQQDDDLRQAVEEALKICPDGGHVTIDDISNPERAMKVFLFAKAAGGNDKFQLGEETKNKVLEHIARTDLSINSPLKELYKDAIDNTKAMSSDAIRERLKPLAQTQQNTLHSRPRG